MSFRVFQLICEGHENQNTSLWFKEANHDCFPMPGDLVELWEDGPTNYVHRRHYDSRMRAGVDMKHLVANPVGPLPTIEHPWWHYNTPWRDGTIEELLAAMKEDGWRKYIPGED